MIVVSIERYVSQSVTSFEIPTGFKRHTLPQERDPRPIGVQLDAATSAPRVGQTKNADLSLFQYLPGRLPRVTDASSLR